MAGFIHVLIIYVVFVIVSVIIGKMATKKYGDDTRLLLHYPILGSLGTIVFLIYIGVVFA